MHCVFHIPPPFDFEIWRTGELPVITDSIKTALLPVRWAMGQESGELGGHRELVPIQQITCRECGSQPLLTRIQTFLAFHIEHKI